VQEPDKSIYRYEINAYFSACAVTPRVKYPVAICGAVLATSGTESGGKSSWLSSHPEPDIQYIPVYHQFPFLMTDSKVCLFV